MAIMKLFCLLPLSYFNGHSSVFLPDKDIYAQFNTLTTSARVDGDAGGCHPPIKKFGVNHPLTNNDHLSFTSV